MNNFVILFYYYIVSVIEDNVIFLYLRKKSICFSQNNNESINRVYIREYSLLT